MEAVPTAAVAPVSGPPAPRGGYRGRGGMPMRGFDRGRPRGIGRGHFMGGVGRVGGPGGMGGPMPQGMMAPRGMRIPRGGQGYPGRGGFMPRGGGMRGGRPPMYAQTVKQHSGADNNKTVSPVPTATGNTTTTADEETSVSTSPTTAVGTASGTNSISAPVNTNGSNGGISHPRGPPRGGRGGFMRGGGRGGYNPHHSNGVMHGSMGGAPDHGGMPMRRGGPPRGRGGYGQSINRSPHHHQQHSANTQIAPVPTLKRGAIGGHPGPKRGRYEGIPYSQRPMTPKYHQQQQHVASMPPQSSYAAPPSHHAQTHGHHGYASHDQSQAVDPYAQSYAAPVAQTTYNGYAQSSDIVWDNARTLPTHTNSPINSSTGKVLTTSNEQLMRLMKLYKFTLNSLIGLAPSGREECLPTTWNEGIVVKIPNKRRSKGLQ
ncbi:serine/threonine-protein phosphatase 1 regulatory subunit 10-like [Teleopsis dalmanni]|uniref:serine/threonine-protein phosphatase 1 regulatory subunit 10-like n=1 Tax=Teleopsis dalmanni TaxID=139649 RepID=UPI0018CE246F|nr:serine/threonine-protein phosphatase 1 regulatory subunit 10-like [Teleopsis dalmanni]